MAYNGRANAPCNCSVCVCVCVCKQLALPTGPERIRMRLWMTVAHGVDEPSRLRHFLPLLRDASPCHRCVRDLVATNVLRLVKRAPAACAELFHRDVRDIIMQPNTAGREMGLHTHMYFP